MKLLIATNSVVLRQFIYRFLQFIALVATTSLSFVVILFLNLTYERFKHLFTTSDSIEG